MRLAPLLALGLLLTATPALAKPLSGQRDDLLEKNISCAYENAEVLRWTPADGPMAAFVAKQFEAHRSLWIGLGYDAKGFWSAEGDTGGDGCDDCSTLNLVRTSFDGKERKVFKVGAGLDEEPGTTEERQLAIKKKIFTVAAGPLDVKALKHDYTFTLPKHDEEGKIEKFTGWFAEVKKKDGGVLRFASVSESYMCWCIQHWRGYTLAKPKPKS